MDAAEAELLMSSIRKGNTQAANDILKKCVENSKLGFDDLFEKLNEDDIELVETYLRTDKTREFLTSAIEKKTRQIDNYFTAIENGYWP